MSFRGVSHLSYILFFCIAYSSIMDVFHLAVGGSDGVANQNHGYISVALAFLYFIVS